jgi:hypothetical protein
VQALLDDWRPETPREALDRIEAERRGTPFLIYRDGHGDRRLVDLDSAPPRLSIGRHHDCDVALHWDGEASRLHADLERIAGEWTIVDDGRSRNGTFLNGDRVLGRRRIADEDVIRIGRTRIRFRCPARARDWQTTHPAGEAGPIVSPGQRRVLVELCRPLATSTSFASPASNPQIARELVISLDTVKGHMRALFEAFRIPDMPQNEKRAALAREAIERGLVTRRELERRPLASQRR